MKIQKIRVSVSKKVSKSENERVRASDDDQELSLKPDGPYCGLEGCQKARSIYYGKRRARVSASSIRRGRPKYVGWFVDGLGL